MKRVLFVGQTPESVDFSDPSLPPGFNASKIHAGIDAGVRSMAHRGWQAELCLVDPSTAVEVLERQLTGTAYDCVVLGGGLRLPPKSLQLFEALVNVVHRTAQGSAIAFNTRPEDTADAAARWIDRR